MREKKTTRRPASGAMSSFRAVGAFSGPRWRPAVCVGSVMVVFLLQNSCGERREKRLIGYISTEERRRPLQSSRKSTRGVMYGFLKKKRGVPKRYRMGGERRSSVFGRLALVFRAELAAVELG